MTCVSELPTVDQRIDRLVELQAGQTRQFDQCLAALKETTKLCTDMQRKHRGHEKRLSTVERHMKEQRSTEVIH